MNDAPDDEGATRPLGAPDDSAERPLPPPRSETLPPPEPAAPSRPAGSTLQPPPSSPDAPDGRDGGNGAGDAISPRMLLAGIGAGVLVIAALVWALTRGGGDGIEGSGPLSNGSESILDTTTPGETVTSFGGGVTTVLAPVVPSSAPPPSVPLVATTLPVVATVPPTVVPPTVVPPTVPSVATTLPGGLPPASLPVTTGAPPAPGSSVPSSSVPSSGAAAIVGAAVPDVAAFTQSLTPAEEVEATLALAAEARHDVAVAGPVRTLCAAVRLSGPVQLAGRWERNGRAVQSTGLSLVDAPGLGDCLDDDEGDALEDGTYQFLVIDDDGNESAAGTVVVGAARVEQQLVNRGTAPICAVRIAPTSAGYFDAYRFDTAPIAPGATITLAVAAVEQEVRVTSCDREAETLASFRFTPDPASPLPLVDPP